MSDHFISREQAEGDLLLCSAFLAERIKSSDGHAGAMMEIVPRMLERGEVDLAAELANAIDDPFTRDRLLVAIAEKCVIDNDDEYALQLAEAIDDQAIQAQAFERIGLVHAEKGDAGKAEEIAGRMAHGDYVRAGVAVNQVENGNAEAANATLDGIDFAPARFAALREIAVEKIKKEDFASGAAWLDRTAEAAREIEHAEESVGAMCEIGSLFVEAKRNDKAVETFAEARKLAEEIDNTHRDRLLASCALGFLNAGSSELSERTLDLVNDKTQMASALVGVARDHWKKEEKEDAVETLEEASEIIDSQRESETRDSRVRNSVITTIAAQFAGFGKAERSVEIALASKDPKQQSAALTQVARVQAAQKEYEEARRTVDSIPDETDRIAAIIGIADAAGESSLDFLDEAAELAENVSQPAPKAEIFTALAERFAAKDQQEKVKLLVEKSLAALMEIRDESSKAVALASLASVRGLLSGAVSENQKDVLLPLIERTGW